MYALLASMMLSVGGEQTEMTDGELKVYPCMKSCFFFFSCLNSMAPVIQQQQTGGSPAPPLHLSEEQMLLIGRRTKETMERCRGAGADVS